MIFVDEGRILICEIEDEVFGTPMTARLLDGMGAPDMMGMRHVPDVSAVLRRTVETVRDGTHLRFSYRLADGTRSESGTYASDGGMSHRTPEADMHVEKGVGYIHPRPADGWNE